MSDDLVQQIKQRCDIVSIIGQHVRLIKRGQNYVGLCPFHSEKSGSFYVSPAKHMFHCFGCGESGDVLSFIMKIEHISFRELLIEKANEFNIPHNLTQSSHFSSEVDLIRQALNEFQIAYSDWFLSDTYLDVLNYCRDRGLTTQTVGEFGLGVAPNATLQRQWLQSKPFVDRLKQARLLSDSNYPLLQNRLVFPIHNSRGLIVGFSGRAMMKGQDPKYINSPESIIFNKKNVLYGLHKAKKPISKLKTAIVVEGYFDVIAMHQHGFEHTVAVMGTALTQPHVKQLAHLCKRVILMFDADEAGRNAIQKSIQPLQEFGISPYVVRLEDNDPGDFFLTRTTDDMQLIVDNATHYIDFFIDLFNEQMNNNDPREKSAKTRQLALIIHNESDPVVKELAIKKWCELVAISESVFNQILDSCRSDQVVVKKQVSIQPKEKYIKAKENVIYFVITNLEFRRHYMNEVIDYIEQFQSANIKAFLLNSTEIDQEFIFKINDSEIRNYLLSLVIQFTENEYKYTFKEMEAYVKLLREQKLNQRILEIKESLKNINLSNSNEKELLLELANLMKQIKK